jgi:HTH-type transcriptional regulator / antitoxin HigA
MTEDTFRPNWASPPGETIQAITSARGLSVTHLRASLAIHDHELNELLTGNLQISTALAKRLADVLGSTARFWIERDRQYRASLKAIELAAPELRHWVRSFPVSEMVKAQEPLP